ncbi:MAG TPA: histidine kinase [Lautropia sp.]|nr:histidine kinase [Lautropia sp.]
MTSSRSDDLPRTRAGVADFTWRGVLRRLMPYLAVVLVADTLIAVMLTVAIPPSPDLPPTHKHFLGNFVYSQFIGLSILLLIAVPRLTFWPRDKLAPWQAALHLAAAIVIGFVAGSSGASLVLGTPSLIRAREPGDNMLLVAALVTVLASVGSSSFFWLRERVAALDLEASSQRARAEMERARAETAWRQATEAQLNLIRTQLEPHMLFNTLANLRSLMIVDPPRAQVMMDRLISFLRATLAASRHDETTLQAEFDLLRDYLELIAIRMGPRLKFSLILPGHVASLPVLPLLLQPLVENAVRHGIEPAIEGGRIEVRARGYGDHLELVVEDTGLGFPASRSGIRKEPDERLALDAGGNGNGNGTGTGTGFGLAQIRERLRTAYGSDASLTIESPAVGAVESRAGEAVASAAASAAAHGNRTGGTRVTITLPAPRSPDTVILSNP